MNWGYKLLFTFIVFGCLMGYLVFRAVTTDFELVEKDYYKNELRYQQVIDGTKRANSLGSPVMLTQTGEGIRLQLPEEMKNKPLSGSIWFYCAYDAKKDKKIPLQSDAAGSQLISAAHITPGNYTVKINWESEGSNYYTEKSITVF